MAIEKFGEIYIGNLTDEDIKYFNNKNNTTVCKCGSLLRFEIKDIDYSKKLPHIKCFCGRQVQLHSKYLKLKDGRQLYE